MNKKKQKRKTTGELYIEAVEKGEKYETEELRREMHKDYENHIIDCVKRGMKEFEGDFFVHVETKKERLTPNVIRNYFIARKSCPYPFYDQTIYKLHRKEDLLEFLWVIPAKDVCIQYRDHALEVPKEEKDLLNFILDFYDGILHKLCDKLNKEQDKETNNDRTRETIN